jgi:hypothetical protein
VPEQWRGNGAQRNDLAIAEAEGPQGPEAHTDLLCAVCFAINYFALFIFYIFNIFHPIIMYGIISHKTPFLA